MNYLEFVINKNLEKQHALLKVAAEQESWFHRHPYLTAALATIPAVAIPSILLHGKILPQMQRALINEVYGPANVAEKVFSRIGHRLFAQRARIESYLKDLEKLLG